MVNTVLVDGLGSSITPTAYRALAEHVDIREIVDEGDELDATTNERFGGISSGTVFSGEIHPTGSIRYFPVSWPCHRRHS